MPDLSHLWQRFMLACALLFGLALGVGATVFGYSNTTKVDLGWSVFHLGGVPLWTVALVPLALVLVAGTLYHWLNSLHHFSEHMRHRHRVQELEKELTSLRAHLDSLLGMPDHSIGKVVADETRVEPEPADETPVQPVASNGDLSELSSDEEPEPAVVTANGATEVATPKPKTAGA